MKTILLVDDDPSVRGLTKKMLEHLGYTVLAAANGQEALDLLPSANVDLLMTDIIMPGMHGRDLAARVTALSPATKVIFLSGYTDETITPHGVLPAGVNYIEKPFSAPTLAQTVKRVLEE